MRGIMKRSVNIHNKQVQFLADTSATVDLVDFKTYDLLRNEVTLNKSNIKIYAYGAAELLPLKGRFLATVESKTRNTVSQFYVVEGTGGNLFSDKTALIKLVNTVTQMPSISKNEKPKESSTNTHRQQLTRSLTSETAKATAVKLLIRSKNSDYFGQVFYFLHWRSKAENSTTKTSHSN